MQLKINYKKILMQRYIIYPLFVGFVTYLILDVISAFPTMNEVMMQYSLYNTLKQYGIDLTFEQGQLLYSYLVGYAFGTISMFSKHVKKAIGFGLISLGMTIVQYYMCFYFFSTLSIFLLVIEILFIIPAFICIRLFKFSFLKNA